MAFQRIALCLDSNYEPQAVTLLTQIRHHEKDFASRYFFEIVTIPDEKLEILESFLKNNQVGYQISHFDVGLKDSDLKTSIYPRATYLKLYLCQIKEWQNLSYSSNLIYLDLDLLIQRGLPPLVEIAQVPMGDLVCKAVVERWKHSHLADIKEINSYFNAGVLILNPEAWRTLDLTNMALKKLKQYGATLFAEQDYFNLILADTDLFEALPSSCNQMPPLPLAFVRNESIIHFAGVQKPWNAFGWHWSYTRYRRFYNINYPNIRFSGLEIAKELKGFIREATYRIVLFVYLRTLKKLRGN